MNRLTIIFCCLAFGLNLQGQNLEKLFIGSGGGYFKNATYQSLVSIGEPVTGFVQGSSATAEQGFASEEGNGSTSSLNTAHSRANISLYPNPFGDNLFIKVPTGVEVKKVEIFNILGVRVVEKSTDNSSGVIHLDGLNNLPEGIYMVTVQIGDKKQIYKINHQ